MLTAVYTQHINYQQLNKQFSTLSLGGKEIKKDRFQRAERESVKSACPRLTPAAVCQSSPLNTSEESSQDEA